MAEARWKILQSTWFPQRQNVGKKDWWAPQLDQTSESKYHVKTGSIEECKRFNSFYTWTINDKLFFFYIKSNKIVQLFKRCFQMYLHININSTALLILNQHESNMETNCTNLQFTWLKNTDITFTANNIIWSSEETVTIHFQAVTDGVTNVRAVNLANVWNLRRRNRSWAPPTGCFMYSFSRTPLMQVSVFLPKNYLSVLLSHTHTKILSCNYGSFSSN